MNARGQRVQSTGRSIADVRVVSSSVNAGIFEPLPCLPWLTTVAAHRKALKESAICYGVLDRNHIGVARGDAALVIEGFRAAEGPAQTTRALIRDVPRNGRTLWPDRAHVKGIEHDSVPLKIEVARWRVSTMTKSSASDC